MGPLFVSVRSCDGLVDPTPVGGNTIEPGRACRDPAAPAAPSSAAIAGSRKIGVDTERVPLTRPTAVGVNLTPTEQLAPGPNVEPHAFCVIPKGVEDVTINSDAVRSLLFEIVANCAGVDCPTAG